MRKIIGVGETILDIIFKDEQPHAAVPGGSVFNGLVSLARLDVPVVFISELGNDRVGRMIRTFMEKNGLGTRYVDCFPDGKSPVSLAFLDENQDAQYTFYKDYPAQRLEVPLPPIEEDDIFIFGSYYSLNPVLRERIVELLNHAREQKAILYYDPNFRKAHAHEAIRLLPTVLENFEYADIVRGSDEDFYNLFGKKDLAQVYREHIRFYCPQFLSTRGSQGIELFTPTLTEHFDTPAVQAASTIGAGDNFNAGLLYGLLKYDVRRNDLATLSQAEWAEIIRCGTDLAAEVCRSYSNYISPAFAEAYKKLS